MVDWGNMEYEILVKIFMALNMMDVITGVAGVCRSWRAAVHSPLLWEKIDFVGLYFHPNISHHMSYWAGLQSQPQLMQLIDTIFKFSGDAVTSFYFGFYSYIDHRHITLAADRFPNLKRLAIPLWNRLNEPEFIRCLARWKNLESLTFSCIYNPINVIRSIQEHCNNFTKLKMLCNLDNACAEAIMNHLPNLKVLSLRSSFIYKDALHSLVENAKSLVSLNVTHCLVLENSFPPSLRMDSNQMLEVETMEKAKRLEKFLWCDKRSCERCMKMVMIDEDNNIKWLEIMDDVWREDEFFEFAM